MKPTATLRRTLFNLSLGLVMLTLSLAARPAHAGFNAATTFATGVQPIGIATGDFDGDGKLDLVTANSNNNGNGTVSILLGIGNGTFGAHIDLDAGTGSASSIAVGDFNGDGKPDLVVGKNGTAIRVFINNGSGFAAGVPYATGSQPYAIGTGDFNGDGKLDIATANLNSDDISILLNNGNGTFATAVTSPIGNSPEDIEVNDFNGDGNLDLAVIRQSPSGLSVLLGNGDGTFASALTQSLSGSPRALASGDLNADGKLDLAIANDISPGEVDVLLGNGDGTFGSSSSFGTGAFPRSLAINEFDGDAKLDLAVPSTSTASADVLLGTGTGTFGAAAPNSVGASANPNGITTGDFNGDGKPDIATSDYGTNKVSVLINSNASASPGISINDVRVTEGDSGTVNATFTIRLSHVSASTVTVNAATANGTANGGLDYTGVSTPITFNPGVVTQTVNVPVIGDTMDENNETFLVKLSGATNAFIQDAIGVGTIVDNDAPPAVHIADANVVEGDSGVAPATFAVGLSAPSGKTVTVNFAATNGTGANAATLADGDFLASPGTVSFAPGITSQTATITVQGDTKVEANENFRVVLSAPVNATLANTTGIGTIINDDGPNILATGYAVSNESCGSGNGAVDPGETVDFSLFLRNFSATPTSNLKATLQNTGGVLGAPGAQTYGALTSADTAQAHLFTFTADPSLNPGDVLTLTFALTNGATTLPSVTVPVVLSRREPLRENFDGSVATALPSGWVGHISVGQAGDSAWRTVASQSDTLPNAAFGPSQAHVTDNTLTSPAFLVTTASAQLIFRNSYNFEDSFDGAVLEISLNGGAFTDILTAGGSFVSGGYVKTLSSSFSNPLAGRQAWTGNSNGYVTTIVHLPAAAAGNSVQLRWHLGTDSGISQTGQFIDTVVVTDGIAACGTPTVTTATLTATRGLALSAVTVATFVDTIANSPAAYAATINWGDGTTTAGTVVSNGSNGSFKVTGTHTYSSAGSFTTIITVNQMGGGNGTAQGKITVTNPPLALSLKPSTISETGGPQAVKGTVLRGGSLAAALTVTMVSSDAARASVPASVLIPAGAKSAPFFIAAHDNGSADGPEKVSIAAVASGYVTGKQSIFVVDNEAHITLSFSPKVFLETGGANASTGTLTRNTPTTYPLVIKVTSDHPTKAKPQFLVTIPAGQVSVNFPVAAIDNAIADGPVQVKFTARAKGYPTTSFPVTVLDNEAKLSLVIAPATFAENAGAGAATATISTNTPNADGLTVTLSSSDTTEAKVPSYVIIPAGKSSVSFPINAVDDAIADGPQTVTITANASALAFAPASQKITVTDNDPAAHNVIAPASPTSLSDAGAQAQDAIARLAFNGALDAATATDAAHYTVTVNGTVAEVESVSYNAGSGSITLRLPDGSLKSGDHLVIAWQGLLDAKGRVLSGQTNELTVP